MAVLYEWDAATSSFRQTAVILGDDGGKPVFLRILGYFDTAEALSSAVPNPAAGDCYGVGMSSPYTFYVWDGVTLAWRENGILQGPPGSGIRSIERTSGTGEAGSLDIYTITLTDGGTSAFSVRNGANGTSIRSIERTSGNGAPGTTDIYTITLTDGSTSAFSVRNGAATAAVYTASVGTAWTGTQAPYTQEVGVAGILASDTILWDIVPTGVAETDDTMLENAAKIYDIRPTAAGILTVRAKESLSAELPIVIQVVR